MIKTTILAHKYDINMKNLRTFFTISFLLLCGCTTINDWCKTWDCQPNNQGQETINTENETWVEMGQSFTLEDAIFNYIADNNSCSDWSKLFVNYAELWQDNADFYINAIGEWFYIDERWNLNNSCGFSIPMKVTVSTQDWANYVVTNVIQARDWSDYDESIREMFSEEAVDRLYKWNYRYIDGRTLLEMAEEYFGVTIIPETENNFECKFCDKLWYYEPLENEDWKSNELAFNYVSENNGNNKIYFWSDWTFEAKWSRDEWKWTWTFWKDANTVIVSNENLNHVYDRYIITNVDENNLNTILEIIQK